MATYSFTEFMKKAGATPDTIKPVTVPQQTGFPAEPKTAKPSQPGYLSRVTDKVSTDLATRADRVGAIKDRYATGQQGALETGVQAFGQGAGAGATALETTVGEIPGVKQAVGAVGAGINWLANSDYSVVKALGDVIGKSKSLQDIVKEYDTNPRFKDSVDAVANTVRFASDVKGAVDTTTGAVNAVQDKIQSIGLRKDIGTKLYTHGESAKQIIANTDPAELEQMGGTKAVMADYKKNVVDALRAEAKAKGNPIYTKAADAIDTVEPNVFDNVQSMQNEIQSTLKNANIKVSTPKPKVDAVLTKEPLAVGQDLANKVKLTLAESNVEPRVKASAQRLAGLEGKGEGTLQVKDPISTYDEFLNQEKKYKVDVKQDTAAGVVGQRIGDAFDKVVKQRQAVGKVLNAELKKVGGTKTNITNSFDELENTLHDEGVVYDAETKKLTPIQSQVKIPAEDQVMLSKYVSDLNKLGAEPTIKELDSFISRKSSELDLYKQKNNIMGTTNGERIIKGHLAELRKEFSPETTGNQALKAYSDARATYSDLSDVLEEGQSFLGRKTLSGDYAKDASLAKSSVQSLLNNGKKDFLVKLEALTGYPALDETTLALQAMKDSGNVMGRSLLEMFKNGNVPTSPSGITKRIADFALEKGARAFTGTPEEQTRMFLESLKKAKP